MDDYRECVHIKADCIHKSCKCSECPMTDLICDEFYSCIDRCYEEAHASGCLAGIELGKKETIEKGREYCKNFIEQMVNDANEIRAKIPITDTQQRLELSMKILALRDAYSLFNEVWNRLEDKDE